MTNKTTDKEPNKLTIYPEGFLGDEDCLIFRQGLAQCGKAKDGMFVQVGTGAGGGVITNDDLRKLKNAINRHLREVKKEQ